MHVSYILNSQTPESFILKGQCPTFNPMPNPMLTENMLQLVRSNVLLSIKVNSNYNYSIVVVAKSTFWDLADLTNKSCPTTICKVSLKRPENADHVAGVTDRENESEGEGKFRLQTYDASISCVFFYCFFLLGLKIYNEIIVKQIRANMVEFYFPELARSKEVHIVNQLC